MSDERSNFRSSNSSGYGNSGYEGQGQGRGGYDSPGNSSGPYVRPLQQQYSGGGRSGGRSGGEGHGRGEGRGRGVGRGRAEPLLPPEQKQLGTVANIKENFGFIQGGDFGRVFFHFSEVLGPEPLQQGDAVLFGLRDDPRTGKTAAVQIVVVAAEELRSVDVEPGRVVGNIMVAPKRGRRDADAQTGRVQVQLGGEGTEVLSFAANDMVPDSPGLYAGDIVELSVGFERISRRRRACQMAFLESTLPRLQGAAATIKDSFGFINTPDSSEQFFFHFSELPDELRGEGELRVGQEFEFSVMDSEQSRPQPTGGRGGGGGSNLPSAKCAVRLKPLQRGTLDWMESMPGVYVGEIAQVTQDKRRGASGRLACTARVLDESLPPSTEGTSVPAALAASVTDASALQTAPSELHGTMLSFSCSSVEAAVDAVPSNEVSRPAGMSADVRLSAAFSKSTESAETLKAQSLLLPGTYVVFRLQRERPSGQLRAIEVVALSEAEGVREDGVVESIKDGLGYIELVDREGRAFFHVSALPEGVPLSTARFTELRFTARASTHAAKGTGVKLMAYALEVLPKGTLKTDEVVEASVVGIIKKLPAKGKPPVGTVAYGPGLEASMQPAASSPAAEGQVMAPKFKEPKARSDVVRSWRSVEPVVVAEAPAAATPEGALAVEGEGVAAGVGEGAVEPPPAAAEEVVHQEGEAVHQEGEGEAHDGRFDDAEAEGVHQEAAPAVEGEAQEAKAGSAPPPGVLTTQFRLADASDGSRLTVGDEVTFTLVRLQRTGKLAAREVQRIRYAGVVDSIRGGYGFLKNSAFERPLFFHMSEVTENVSDLRAGDECTFSLGLNTRTKERQATGVTRTSQTPLPTPMPSRPLVMPVRERMTPAGVIRQAKGPDGTTGFARGRGQAVNPAGATDQLADQLQMVGM